MRLKMQKNRKTGKWKKPNVKTMKEVWKSLVNLYESSSPAPKMMSDDYNKLHLDACLPFNFALYFN